MKPVRAGKLRHRITIEQLVTSLDSDGATVEDWVAVFSRPIPAEVVASSGREFIAASATQSKISTRMKIRFRPEIAPNMRALHRTEVYNIEAVLPDPDSRMRYLTLMCSSGVSPGQ